MRYSFVLLVVGVGYAYVASRLIVPLHLPASGAAASALALLVVFGALLLYPLSWRSAAARALFRHRPIRWLSLMSMALLSTLFGLLVIRDLLFLAGGLIDAVAPLFGGGSLAELVGLSPERIERASSLTVLGLSFFAVASGYLEVQRGPQTRNVRVAIPNLPDSLAGFRIVQLSDIHIGESVRRQHIEDLVDKVNPLRADLVAITGDLVDGSVQHLGREAEPLSRLVSRHGTYFCAGNHDHYSGLSSWTEFLRGLGIHVLVNEHRVIHRDTAALLVAGVDDWSNTDDAAADVRRSLEGGPGEAVRILLAHHPRTAPAAARLGIDLTLSGHTHGGQFLPWSLVAGLIHSFSAGLYRVDEMWLYVSRGTFYWGPPVRTLAPAEITCFELHPERVE